MPTVFRGPLARARVPRLIGLLLAAAFVAGPADAQRNKPPVPDLTAGGESDGKHDWNLGPIGARGWMWGWKLETRDARQVLITAVAEDSPADGKLEPGDVLLGVGGERFDGDPRRVLGAAITAAEAGEDRGRLTLLRCRDGKEKEVTLKLDAPGAWGARAPWDCGKSQALLDAACEHVARNMKGDIDGMMNGLLLLATGDKRYHRLVGELAETVAPKRLQLTLFGRTSGLLSWQWGYRNLFLTEYYLATGDKDVLPAIREYSRVLAEGQSVVGTWGHGMAWPDLNDGRLHGSLGGYGALNQAGLINHLSLVLAQRCGVDSDEIRAAIARANRFAAFYAGKGAIPYGDHRPGWDSHDDNGKSAVAAIIFDLQGMRDEARFFAKMTVASYGERERGHTGNYFSYLWGPLGAARAGDDAAAAFLAEQRWYYDLARRHDGMFPYQGGAGMDGGEHQYGKWDCTAAFALALTLPDRALYITGRDSEIDDALVGAELADAIESGRGFDNWDLGIPYYEEKSEKELVGLLESWSPAVRARAATALGKRDDVELRPLLRLLDGKDMDARYGAWQALGSLGTKAADAVPVLVEALEEDDVWLRIQACYALAGIGEPAREAVPAMLRIAVSDHPDDPREFTQRYLAFCLFYPGGALNMRGLIGRSLEGVDLELIYPAVERLLQNDDGRARAATATVLKHLTFEEAKPLVPAILQAVEVPSPSGVMFANGVRLDGLRFLSEHRIAEGMELCLAVPELDKWGKQDRILRSLEALQRYGGAAKPLLPRLSQMLADLEAHREARNMPKQIELCRETIALIESADGAPELLYAEDLAPAGSR
jgi:HEAT repeat protein